MGLKSGKLDLDLQGQIGLETCVIPCECNNNCNISKTCDLDLDNICFKLLN